MAVNYVKFQRGTIAAYNRLTAPNDDTLYFVYESKDATDGKLYLGKKLISGIGSDSGVTTLAALTDVLINSTPPAGSFLMSNAEGKWVPVTTEKVAAEIAGAINLGFQLDTNAFSFTDVIGEELPTLQLKNFPTASSDGTAIAFKGVDGSLQWGTPKSITALTTSVGNLQTALDSIQDTIDDLDEIIGEKVGELNTLTYSTVDSLDEATKPNTIYLIPVDDKDNTTDKYNEYLVVKDDNDNIHKELIGTIGNSINLDGYVTTEKFNSTIGDLNTIPGISSLNSASVATIFSEVVGDLSALQTDDDGNMITIIDRLNDINERLIWQEIE